KAEIVPTGTFVWVDTINGRLIEYPIAEQTLVMVKNPGEGGRDDDAISCRALGGAQMQVEVASTWQIDLANDDPNTPPPGVAAEEWRKQAKTGGQKAIELYLRRPGQPLVGDINNSIEGSVVRQAVRNAIGLVCGEMAPLDMMTSRKGELQTRAEQLAQAELV